MVGLRLRDGALLVQDQKGGHLLDWQHRLYFTAVSGFALDAKNLSYMWADRVTLPRVLLETLEYLSGEGIAFDADDSVQDLIRQLEGEASEYLAAVAASLAHQETSKEAVPPPGFVRQLKPYQARCVEHLLAVRNGANFSVPGSGKTTIVLATLAHLRQQYEIEKLLVIGPRSCFLPWEDEYVACFGVAPRVARLTGTKSARSSLYLTAEQYELFLSTYQTAANDFGDIVQLCHKFKVFVVIDESHNIKKLEGGVWAESVLETARHASRRAVLSGTPAPNSYADLWTQVTFLWPGEQVLGDRNSYRFRCDDPTEHEAIRASVRPIFSRVKKSDLGLPEAFFQRIQCDLNPYQESIYRALSARVIGEVEHLPEERQMIRQWRKARMVRLIQAASNPALLARYSEEFDVPPLSGEGASVIQLIHKYPKFETPSKIEATIRQIDQLALRERKVVVWTSFVHNIRMLEHLLNGRQLFTLYGAVPRDESEDVEFNREQQIRAFKEAKGAAILLANPAACAESISLHKVCRDAIYLDRTFNCGQYMQSLDRIHRLGLSPDETVTYYLLIARKTIDETVDRRLEVKERNMLQLLDGDLPVGTLEADPLQLGQSEDEEAVDFLATMEDIERQGLPEGEPGIDTAKHRQ